MRIPHPNPPSNLPLHPIPLGLPSVPAPSTCLMHADGILMKIKVKDMKIDIIEIKVYKNCCI